MSKLTYIVKSMSLAECLFSLEHESFQISKKGFPSVCYPMSREGKTLLIRSVLEGFPIKPILLLNSCIDEKLGRLEHYILEGKKELIALREFAGGMIPVKEKYFSELSYQEQQAFYKYEVPIIQIDCECAETVLKAVDSFKQLF